MQPSEEALRRHMGCFRCGTWPCECEKQPPQKPPEVGESGSVTCSMRGGNKHGIKSYDWDKEIEGLLKDMREGCCESKVAVAQFEVAGKRVELQLLMTDDEDDFQLEA